jgi:hypothetical protein
VVEIADKFTDEDWQFLEKGLRADFANEALWNKALDVFESRLNERYIKPAEEIQNKLSVTGEGFAITAILCSLVEALETFYEGKCYKYEKPRNNNEYGNGKSKTLFVSFLTSREPFKNIFNLDLAEDFYKNVRCALLHEAMTRDGWRIRVDTDVLVAHKENGKVLNRFYFLENLKDFIKSYRAEVLTDKKRKNAFIRKMNCICKNA